MDEDWVGKFKSGQELRLGFGLGLDQFGPVWTEGSVLEA